MYYVPRISDAEEFVDAQVKVHRRLATVTLVDGTEIRLDSTSLYSDSVSGVKEDTRVQRQLFLPVNDNYYFRSVTPLT